MRTCMASGSGIILGRSTSWDFYPLASACVAAYAILHGRLLAREECPFWALLNGHSLARETPVRFVASMQRCIVGKEVPGDGPLVLWRATQTCRSAGLRSMA